MKITILDTVFSQYIRLRDSNNGIIKCCSCGKFVSIKQSDAGHFINRQHMNTRFDETNVHAQCRKCNRFDEGNLPAYALFIQKKYGEDYIEKLLIKKRIVRKFTDFEIKALVKHYRNKIKELL